MILQGSKSLKFLKKKNILKSFSSPLEDFHFDRNQKRNILPNENEK